MWRQCGAVEVVGGGKGFGRAGVEQGILQQLLHGEYCCFHHSQNLI